MTKKQTGAFALYATILVCALFFFLLGVYVGGRLAGGPPVAADDQGAPSAPVEDPRPKLDFYEELRKPQEDPSGEATAAAPASTPEIVVDAGPAGGPPPAGEVQTRKRQTGPPTGGSANQAGERYTIQVAALKTAAEARQVLIRLQAKGYAAELIEPIPSDPNYYRVWVGAFEKRAEAETLETRLKGDDFPTYLKKADAGRIKP